MTALRAIDPKCAEGKAKLLFEEIEARLGMVPNVFRTMANSPSVLEGYLKFHKVIEDGVLSVPMRERIALAVSEVNHCAYCLSEHSAVAMAAGLSREEISDSRRGTSPDRKTEAVLQFARQIAYGSRCLVHSDCSSLTKAGFTEEEVAEVIATIVLTLFKNYFNRMAGTHLDYPRVDELPGW